MALRAHCQLCLAATASIISMARTVLSKAVARWPKYESELEKATRLPFTCVIACDVDPDL